MTQNEQDNILVNVLDCLNEAVTELERLYPNNDSITWLTKIELLIISIEKEISLP